jgi:hypothetical protein
LRWSPVLARADGTATVVAVSGRSDRRRWAGVVAGTAGAVWIATAGVLYRPAGSSLPITCPFHALTGLDCPGCGSTRALGALARLDPVAALDHNALVPGALAFVLVSWVLWVRAAWAGEPSPAIVRGPAAIAAVGIGVVMFAVVRNLEAGSWLASGLSTVTP